MKNIIALLLIWASSVGCTQDAVDVQVVLLAGQSNMAGAGNYDLLEDGLKTRIESASERVDLSFNGKEPVPLSWYPNKPSEKYNFDKRFGPELLIGLQLAESYPNQRFLLIKRSQGGTALYGAWNPEWDSLKSEAVEKGFKQKLKLHEMHLSDIQTNLERLSEQGLSYKIFGMVWMQGENDAAKEVSATTYDENLQKLIQSYRVQFDSPEMPFVLGQINSRYGRFKEGPAIVREAMEVVASEDEKVEVIKTTTDTSWHDFPKHSDNVHYNHEGQRRLGSEMAERLIELTSR